MRAAKRWLLLCAVLFVNLPAAAQVSQQRLVDMMLDCAMHSDGGIWQPKTLLKDGLLRFTYLHETRNLKPGPYDYKDERRYLYVAFWNPSKAAKMIARPRFFTSILLVLASISLPGRAEDVGAILRARIPECAIHQEGGSWIPKELYEDGALRFTYLYEAPKKTPGEYDYR